jgi:tetratricopeptide (TPR) repeat protein
LADVEAKWPQLSAQERAIVLEHLIRHARYDDAQRLIAKTPADHADDRQFLRFYGGLVLKGQGRHAEAIAVFREILAARPDFARVRLELAHTLYMTQEDEGARHHFELVLGGSASNSTLANTVSSYIAAIDGRRRWDFSTYVSIAPSTNLNQGSESRVVYIDGLPFELDEANRKTSGIGVSAGFQGSYRHPVSDRLDLIVSGGAQGKRYNDDDFNDALVNLSVGPRYRYDWGFVGLYAIGDQRWYADEAYATSYGGLMSASIRLGAQDIAYADLSCSRRSFETDWLDNDLSYQDGHACLASGRLDHHFNSATLGRILAGGGRERTGREHLDNDSWFVGAGFYRELGLGLSVYAQGLYTVRVFEGLYPTSTEARDDDRFDASLYLTKRDWDMFGFAPMVQYTYTLNTSNIGFFDYDAHGVSFTLTKRY